MPRPMRYTYIRRSSVTPGVALVASGPGAGDGAGDALVLLSVLVVAAMTVAQVRLLDGQDPAAVTAVQFLGAALLLAGIVAAIATAPLFDRVLTHHLGIAARVFSPIVAFSWFGFIFAGTQSAARSPQSASLSPRLLQIVSSKLTMCLRFSRDSCSPPP